MNGSPIEIWGFQAVMDYSGDLPQTEDDWLVMALTMSFNESDSLRTLSIYAYQWLEFFMNKFIDSVNYCDPFSHKINQMEVYGAFDKTRHLRTNTCAMKNIRNFYAHNITLDDSIPPSVKGNIAIMKYIRESDYYDGPWDELGLESEYHIKAMSTILAVRDL